VKATEQRKQLQAYANKDSLSGDFFSADNQFVRGKAAMLANGPWEVESGIRGKDAQPGLYKKVAYSPAPGGVMVVSGTGSWASGAKDEPHREAALAFMKFMNSKQQKLQQYKNTGVGWPVKLNLSDAELTRVLDPMYVPLVEASETAENTYPTALFLTPADFLTAWTNNWPAYVQGALSTTAFLDRLSQAATTA